MPGSGVQCSPEVLQEFDKLSKKHEYRYVIFKINDEKDKIVVEKTGDSDKTFEHFKNDLPKDKCRYEWPGGTLIVFDLCFETKEKQKREKLIFVYHCPDSHATTGDKFIYSASEDAILRKLGSDAIHAKFHRGGHSEIDLEEIVQEMKMKFK